MNKKTLINIALFSEAKPIIEYFKMQCLQKKPYRIYGKSNLIVLVGGMGKKNSLHVEDIFKSYDIKRAINIGIAGCKNEEIEIGSLFCTNRQLDDVDFATLSSASEPLGNKDMLNTTLVDMEAWSFLHVSKKYLKPKDIFVFKIVSDYLDKTIPKKEFVEKIIKNSIKRLEKYIEK